MTLTSRIAEDAHIVVAEGERSLTLMSAIREIANIIDDTVDTEVALIRAGVIIRENGGGPSPTVRIRTPETMAEADVLLHWALFFTAEAARHSDGTTSLRNAYEHLDAVWRFCNRSDA